MRPLSRVRLALGIAASATLLAAPGLRLSAQDDTVTSLYSGLRWRMLGPFRGGRVNAVAGVPGQPATFYFGSVGGGVWKTRNAGRTWTPVFDSQPVASIGAIAVAPSNPDVVYVGTGEADMRSQISYGNGMYKSVDAGRTWTHIGLDATRQIGRIAIDPRDPNVLFVAALGHVYGANHERGLYRSRDGGATWQQVLFRNENVGAIDVVLAPGDARTVYAAMWNTRRPPWSIYPPSYGAGSGLFRSTDGGDTWTPLTTGLPSDRVGRIGIAISPARAVRVYAIVDAKDGGLFRSDDAGATWRRMSGDERLWGRGWYFCKVAVDPKNPDVVYVSNTSLYRSADGGTTWTVIKGAPGGDDYHQLWIDPDVPERMVLASDQGAIVTLDGAASWSSWYNQPTAQLYHVAADQRTPYWVTGAQQDSGAVAVRTRSPFADISNRDWVPLCAGGEAGTTAPDPLHPDIVFGGTVTRCNVVTGETTSVSPERTMTEPARHAWTQPLVFSRADPHALYFANQFLFVTTDGGAHWSRISPDLTRESPGVPSNLDEATAADAPADARRGVIYAIAPSPVEPPRVWVGTDDGLVHVTRDGGKSWQDVTPSAVTPWSKVVMLEASHNDADTAYAAVDRHRLDDNEPHLFRTRDGGKSWQEIVNGLPRGVYLQAVKEDPRRPGLLYAGTELGVFVSFDAGDAWHSLQLNLPAVSVRDIAVHEDDVVVATHGRGFWAIDSAVVLRQVSGVQPGTAHLFAPAAVVLTPPPSENGTPQPRDEPLTANRPYGAMIDYYLPPGTMAPVTIEITGPAGQVVRRWSSADPVDAVNPDTLNVQAFWRAPSAPPSAEPGMHRWVWNLRGAPSPAPARAPSAPGAVMGMGGPGGRNQPALVPPGTYSVTLTANGRTYTQPLNVAADPQAMR